MNFSGMISNRNLVGRLLRWFLSFIPKDVKLPILQGKLRGKFWIVGAGNHGYWLGSYEYAERKLFEKTIRQGWVVYDIGANAGFYTLLSSFLVGKKGRVYAFEPLSANINYLEKHLVLNKVKNVFIVNKAVWNSDGLLNFAKESDERTTGQISPEGRFKVEAISLDHFAIGKGCPNCLKIDVDGTEVEVLNGAKKLFRDCHPVIFLSVHSDELKRKSLDFLSTFGYRVEKYIEEYDTQAVFLLS